jgi:hypothetical protein
MPDNGDFPRMMNSVGLSPVYDDKSAGFQAFPRYYSWDLATRGKPFPSSQLLFVAAGLAINALVSKTELFDITSLGTVHLVFYALAFCLVAYCGYRSQHKLRWLVYLALLVVFTDVAYVAYFNSLYAEPSALIFFCLTIGFAMVMVGAPSNERKSRRLMVGLFCSAALFTLAKLQNVMLAPLFAVMIYTLANLHLKQKSERFCKMGLWAAIGLLAIAFCYWLLYTMFPMGIRNVNVYDSVFFEIIENSPNPSADLRELGLDGSFAKYKGTNAWSPGVTPKIYSEVYERVGEKRIVLFYIKHPGRFFKLQWRAAKHGFDIRPGYLGNFDSDNVRRLTQLQKYRPIRSGESRSVDSTSFDSMPGTYLSHVCDLNSGFKQRFLVGSSWPMLLFFLVNIGAIGVKLWRFDTTAERRAVSMVHILLVIMAIAQFLTVTLGAGELDLVKHLFQFDVICDVCFIFLVGYFAWLIGPKTKQVKSRSRMIKV